MRVLLTHTPQAFALYYGDAALKKLEQSAEVTRHAGDTPLTPAALLDASRGCEVIVADRNTPGAQALFEQSSELVAFVRCAMDIRTVDVTAASARGILVTRASAGFIPAVAELILGMMIDLARGITAATKCYHARQHPPVKPGIQLHGGTLGIIGYGAIGQYLATVAIALGLRIVIFDPYHTAHDTTITSVPLNVLLKQSDFVVCLAPATAETENLIDAQQLRQMRSDAFFINASRGNLVNESALSEALDTGIIAGAALDVGRAPDQMPSPSLAAKCNVLATPHIGGLTPPAIEHQAIETTIQVAAIQRGELPIGAVNPAHCQRLYSRS